MTDARKAELRSIMLMAWEFHRIAKRAGEDRSFGDSLRGAWKMRRGLKEAASKFKRRGLVRLSPDLIKSPIARVTGLNSQADFRGAYLTARFGR
jgi:hypothetical protein